MNNDEKNRFEEEIIDEVIASFAIDDIIVTKEELKEEKAKSKIKKKIRIEDDFND